VTSGTQQRRRVAYYDLTSTHSELGPELLDAMSDVIAGNAYIGGPWVERFEQDWADYCGAALAVGAGNGTDALSLCLQAAGIGPGDEVVVPANTFVATPMAVVDVGATPIFVDVDPETLLLTGDILRSALTERTAAVIPVHLYGQMVDMDGILEVARPAGLFVLEDAAQAHGATWRGRRAGTHGDAAGFSFYPGKNLGALDGGAVVTDDPDLARRIRLAASHGRSRDNRFRHLVQGRNSRLDGLQAAVLCTKLSRLDRWNEARRIVHQRYERALDGAAVGLVRVHPDARSAHHVEAVLVADRDGVARRLAEAGIETNQHYPVPCHRQEAFTQVPCDPLPVVESAARRELSLPMGPYLSLDEVDYVCDQLVQAVSGN